MGTSHSKTGTDNSSDNAYDSNLRIMQNAYPGYPDFKTVIHRPSSRPNDIRTGTSRVVMEVYPYSEMVIDSSSAKLSSTSAGNSCPVNDVDPSPDVAKADTSTRASFASHEEACSSDIEAYQLPPPIGIMSIMSKRRDKYAPPSFGSRYGQFVSYRCSVCSIHDKGPFSGVPEHCSFVPPADEVKIEEEWRLHKFGSTTDQYMRSLEASVYDARIAAFGLPLDDTRVSELSRMLAGLEKIVEKFAKSPRSFLLTESASWLCCDLFIDGLRLQRFVEDKVVYHTPWSDACSGWDLDDKRRIQSTNRQDEITCITRRNYGRVLDSRCETCGNIRQPPPALPELAALPHDPPPPYGATPENQLLGNKDQV
ncbi:hypothetical protein F5Y18DRAFT_434305 [Xylariaceae sp. FL1019]|nr:hypothetical protein F5Y18DRAFT_434305 [Xylariaceae sp. FL1019]